MLIFLLDLMFFEEILCWKSFYKSLRNCSNRGFLEKVNRPANFYSFYLPVSMSWNDTEKLLSPVIKANKINRGIHLDTFVNAQPTKNVSESNLKYCLRFKTEFLIKIDGGYPKDADDVCMLFF